jgi:hypothetical protein
LFPEESHVFDQIYSDNRVFYFVQLFGVFQQMILEKCVVFSLTKFLLLFLSHVLVFFEIFVQKIVDNLLLAHLFYCRRNQFPNKPNHRQQKFKNHVSYEKLSLFLLQIRKRIIVKLQFVFFVILLIFGDFFINFLF